MLIVSRVFQLVIVTLTIYVIINTNVTANIYYTNNYNKITIYIYRGRKGNVADFVCVLLEMH